MNVSPWHLFLFEPVRLEGPEGRALSLERKTAACLAHLALEGPTPRARLVGLFWPESPESTARNNLSQMLRKLRLSTNSELVVGGDVLALSSALEVDALKMRDAYAQGQHGAFLGGVGLLLGGLSYDDCPDLDDWLIAERERWLEWQLTALRAEADRLEREGAYSEALVRVRTLLELDAVSEEAWRRQMRLLYLLGDRPAALRAYHRCKEILEREFATAPLPETSALAREIDRGTVPIPAIALPSTPIRMLRPPHLVGREREWAQMEAAWAAGQFICVSGEPGAGKTRLAMDFATSRGEVVLNPSRPGDSGIPYATSMRNLRQLLERRPELLPPGALPEWVRRELSRLIPEFEGDEPVPPLQSDVEKLRFFEAQVQAYHRAYQGLAAIVIDDLQFMDLDSMEFGSYMFGKAFPLGQPGGLPPILLTFRRGELPAETEAALRQFVAAGIAVLIDLEPLASPAVAELLEGLDLSQGEALLAPLMRYTGGNPLYVLETVRHLLETGQLGGALPERLPLPPRIGGLLERRLSRLSSPALQAARAAAVLQRDFDAELVAETLGAPLFSLLEAWEELEAAGVVQGDRFSHDLLLEATQAGIPGSVRALLHRGAARALEGGKAHPARIAQHWLEGGKPALAAPRWLEAANLAEARHLRTSVVQALGQAAEAYQQAGDLDTAFKVWRRQGETLFYLEDWPTFLALAERLTTEARTPLHKGISHYADAARHWLQGRPLEALGTAQLGLSCAVQAGDLRLEAELLDLAVAVQLDLPQPPDLDAPLERLSAIARTLGDVHLQVKAHNLRSIHLILRRPLEARGHAEAGERLSLQLNDLDGASACVRRAITVHQQLGDLDALQEALARQVGLHERGEPMPIHRLFLLDGQAHAEHAGGRYAAALEALERALGLEVFQAALYHPELRALRARVLCELGALEAALSEVREVLARLPELESRRPQLRVLLLEVLCAHGSEAEVQAVLTDLERCSAPGVYWAARRDLALAGRRPAPEQLPLLEALLPQAQALGLRGVALAVEVRRNAARLALHLPPLPWEHAERDHPAGVIPLYTWLAVRAGVAEALGDPEAGGLREETHAWVRRTAGEQVPPEHRAHFLEHCRATAATGPLEPGQIAAQGQ